MLPLTKTVAQSDLTDLAVELARIKARAPEYLGKQASPYRAWEWAMALRAWDTWQEAYDPPPILDPQPPYQLLDVGGAGSPLSWILTGDAVQCTIMDPKINFPIEAATHIPDNSIHGVFSISVLEHVARPTGFLRAIHRVLVPGGLCFLTMDCWNCEGPDLAHYHWMRQRIYNPESWQLLAKHCTEDLGFRRFGTTDWTFNGNTCYGYTFCSLALTKEV